MGIMGFTYDTYERLLITIRECGYTISNYHNYQINDKSCILRHDVDMDIDKSLEFALFESKIWNGGGGYALHTS